MSVLIRSRRLGLISMAVLIRHGQRMVTVLLNIRPVWFFLHSPRLAVPSLSPISSFLPLFLFSHTSFSCIVISLFLHFFFFFPFIHSCLSSFLLFSTLCIISSLFSLVVVFFSFVFSFTILPTMRHSRHWSKFSLPPSLPTASPSVCLPF